MTPTEPKGFSLRRWSQRKLDAARKADPGAAHARAVERDALGVRRADVGDAGVSAKAAGLRAAPAPGSDAPPEAALPAEAGSPTAHSVLPQLPAIDSLTIDSDYSGFMQPGVDDSLKCGALKKLFAEPRFNVMDGLDVYIDDYSKPDPIDPDLVRTLSQARYIFNPPQTRVTPEGYVEDVPAEELAAAQQPRPAAPGEPAAEIAADAVAPGSPASLCPAPECAPVPLNPASECDRALSERAARPGAGEPPKNQ